MIIVSAPDCRWPGDGTLHTAHRAPVPWKHWLPWLWESVSQPRPAHRPFPGCRIPSELPFRQDHWSATTGTDYPHLLTLLSIISKILQFQFFPFSISTFVHHSIIHISLKIFHHPTWRWGRIATAQMCVLCTPSWVETMCQGRNLAEPRDMLR